MDRQLAQVSKAIVGLAPAAVTSVTPDYVSLKNYQHLTIFIMLTISSGTDTGAVTLKQATAVAGTGEKALGFDWVWKNEDIATEDLTKTAVTSDTFDAGGAAKSMIYQIEVDTDDLDVDNAFDCVTVNVADITNGTASILYVLSQPRYINQSSAPTSITD